MIFRVLRQVVQKVFEQTRKKVFEKSRKKVSKEEEETRRRETKLMKFNYFLPHARTTQPNFPNQSSAPCLVIGTAKGSRSLY